MASTNANDLLMNAGTKSAKFASLGDIVRGTIADDPKAQQMKKFESEELDFWPSGDPKMQIVVTIATDLREDDDDDGRRNLFIVPRMMPAVRDAVKAAGATGLAVGGTIAVQWTAGSGQGQGNARQYTAAYQPPQVPVSADLLGTTPAAQAAATPAPQATAPAAPLLPATTTPAAAALLTALGAQPTLLTAEPPAGMNIDPALWAALPEAQRAAVLASIAH